MFLKDFIARFQETMRRAGVLARDPLYPVLTMLGEMLVHFTHLQADHAATAERAGDHLAGHLREEAARVQAIITDEGRDLIRAFAHGVSRLEAAAAEIRKGREDVVRGLKIETEIVLQETFTKLDSIRSSRDTLAIVVLMFGLAGAAGVAGFYIGQSQERETTSLRIQATKDPLLTAAMRDGSAAAEHWLRIMQWNHLDQSDKTCGIQQEGVGYRKACSYAFWDTEPLDRPPAPLPPPPR